MRHSPLALVPALVLLAACGSDKAPDAPPADTSKAAAIIAAAADQASQAPGKPGNRALAAPLPGGVLPDFPYNATVDMSTTAGITMRQIHLDLPEHGAQAAMDRIVAQFEAAGLDVGDQSQEKNTLVRSAWTSVEGGAKGIAVVDAGGSHVVMMATDYEADHSRRDDGYVAALRLQVSSR
ncbi:hypothetical protein [Arenimonas sp.]|uniref:hypothetical protein n=1 Tax=Arenimonas sp. TaxID=1872635 RepID=UPI0035B28D89